jgi:A nuclease family of the HNH/ENDO VII superfamily with conserved AHH
VPDEVVRKHDLMREAHRRGLFDPDAPDNIALLAERRANGVVPDKVPGLSEGLPRHQGAHREYSKQVARATDRVMEDLLHAHGTLDNVPDEVLRDAAVDVLNRAWKILRSWSGPHLE